MRREEIGINHRLKRIYTDFNLNYSGFSLTTDFADLHGFTSLSNVYAFTHLEIRENPFKSVVNSFRCVAKDHFRSYRI